MNYRRWLVALLLLLTACATVQRDQWTVVSPDYSAGIPSPLSAPAAGMFRGQLYTLHYNAQGQLVYRSQGQEQVISGESPPGAALTYIVHHADDKGLYVFWRPKLTQPVEGIGKGGDKLIYFRASYDGKTFGKTQRLNTGGGAFEPIVAGNGRGDLYAVWVDERSGRNSDLYLNVSNDAGRSWKAQDILINAAEPNSKSSVSNPTLAVEGEKCWVAWNEGKPASVKVRRSSDRGNTWEEVVVASREEEQVVGLTLVKLPAARGNRLALYWFNEHEFLGAYSADEGRTWTRMIPLPKPDRAAELKVALDPSGKVFLVTGVLPEEKKEDLFAAVSEDGIRFSQPVRLDTNLPYVSTSTGPQIAADGKGHVLVAWHDFRNFRSEIYLNYSADGGKSWLKEDQRLQVEGVLHSYYPQIVADGKGGFDLLWIGYGDDQRQQAKIYSTRIVDGKSWQVNKDGKSPSEARLRKRVSRFWSDRLVSNWGGNYDLMDPYFRQITTKEYYIANQFKTIYYNFEIKDVKISENRATVTIKYTLEVPEFVSPSGKKLKVPKRDEEITEEWIWIAGDWFKVFKDIAGGTFVPY
ncbi:MAG: glycoside hydrolase [Nitrospirae bacterium]|nr:glycoside hydrolase [Nitrospirota bacterium]